MPLEEKAPCGDPRSAFGTCCCTCVFLIETYPACGHQGGDAYCDSGGKDGIFGEMLRASQYGYACAYFLGLGGPVHINWQPHGMCEGYSVRPTTPIKWMPKE